MDKEVFGNHYIGEEIYYFLDDIEVDFSIAGRAREVSSLDPFVIFECLCGHVKKTKEVKLYEYGQNTKNSLYNININCSNY